MGMEKVKHTEILAYSMLHEMLPDERWHLYKVVIAMDDVLYDYFAEKQADGQGS